MAKKEQILNTANSDRTVAGFNGGAVIKSRNCKQKRAPQRGLGVAQLERIRLLEEQRKWACPDLKSNAVDSTGSDHSHLSHSSFSDQVSMNEMPNFLFRSNSLTLPSVSTPPRSYDVTDSVPTMLSSQMELPLNQILPLHKVIAVKSRFPFVPEEASRHPGNSRRLLPGSDECSRVPPPLTNFLGDDELMNADFLTLALPEAGVTPPRNESFEAKISPYQENSERSRSDDDDDDAIDLKLKL
ncbi:hypothetical protein M569_05450 [Genlisea aurea]|uniref:Uncharacterized protein n=1 Tax=Genlisea aurea TaxID=192259 RepID=S8CWI6_9LAMI|nr:hypothetical protein M569_05450 [Genlisea aurea]